MDELRRILTVDWLKEIDDLLVSLFNTQGITGRWVHFTASSSPEDKLLPGNVKRHSGMILTEDGRVFAYELDWDPEKVAPDGSLGWYSLGEKKFLDDGETPAFREIKPDSKLYEALLQKDPRLLEARWMFGLPITDKQRHIIYEWIQYCNKELGQLLNPRHKRFLQQWEEEHKVP